MVKGDYVILLHGLGRSSNSMKKLANYLESEGYEVLNLSYPSRRLSIEKLVDLHLAPVIAKNCCDSNKIHFVTHSMGGILVRYYLHKHEPKQLGRVVMLAPPNQGSEVTDWLKNFFLYRRILGPAGQELGTDIASLPNKLGGVNFDLGVIAGNKTINWINSLKIYGANDGKVAVERTKVDGMQDFLIVPKTHTWIMQSQEVFYQIDYYLKNGFFHQEGEVL